MRRSERQVPCWPCTRDSREEPYFIVQLPNAGHTCRADVGGDLNVSL